MTDVNQLKKIAQQKSKLKQFTVIDNFLINKGLEKADGPLVKIPACYILYKWAMENPQVKTYTYINKRIVFKSILLKTTQKIRLNLRPFDPVGFLLPEGLFGRPSRKDIIEAAAWLQNQKDKARQKRLRDLKRKNTLELNKNTTILTTQKN